MEVKLSSLSGEELLSILRESLAKKKDMQQEPPDRSASACTLIEDDEILDPIDHETNQLKETESNVEEEEGMVLESPQPVRFVKSLGDCGSKGNDDFGFSPEEFLREVLSHPPSVAELPVAELPNNNFSDAAHAFQMGKLSAYLSYDSSFESFYSNLSAKLEDLKKIMVEKKAAWQDSKEKYRVLKDEIDNAIRKMEITALDYKDAEQDKIVLDSVLDWISRVRDKSAVKSESIVKELGAFAKNIPPSWDDMVGSQAITFIKNHYSSASGVKQTTGSRDAAKSPLSDPKSKDISEEKKAVFNRLGSKDNKRSVHEVCSNFNKNVCLADDDTCKKAHICLYCNGPHPVTSCGPSKATERVLCVQWNVDERKCRDRKCPREHRCLRCVSANHTVGNCNTLGAVKSVMKTNCYVWNASSVNYCHTRNCRRVHGCLRCGKKSHGALSCPDNVETYYLDAAISQKRNRSPDRDEHREVRGRID